jgi:hypothetical protein
MSLAEAKLQHSLESGTATSGEQKTSFASGFGDIGETAHHAAKE